MDPDATLKELRELATNSEPGSEARSDRFAELVEALDEWMVRGGALPAAWATVSRPAARVYWDTDKREMKTS